MSEIDDFIFFEKNQLVSIDFETGKISAKRIFPAHKQISKFGKEFIRKESVRIYEDIGSLNQDGYIRVWCKSTLRMKHRLVYWLYHHELPEEIDHIDKNRSNNSISNLRATTRSMNCVGNSVGRKFIHLTTEQVHALCKDIASKKFSITDLAKKYNRSRASIKQIIKKERWKSIADLYF